MIWVGWKKGGIGYQKKKKRVTQEFNTYQHNRDQKKLQNRLQVCITENLLFFCFFGYLREHHYLFIVILFVYLFVVMFLFIHYYYDFLFFLFSFFYLHIQATNSRIHIFDKLSYNKFPWRFSCHNK